MWVVGLLALAVALLAPAVHAQQRHIRVDDERGQHTERLRSIDDEVQHGASTPGEVTDADPDAEPDAEADADVAADGDADVDTGDARAAARPSGRSHLGALRGGPLDRDGDGRTLPDQTGAGWRDERGTPPADASGARTAGRGERAPAPAGDAATAQEAPHTGASDVLTAPPPADTD